MFMADWTQQPRSLAYLQHVLEMFATLRRIELLAKLKRAQTTYTAQRELEVARAHQQALTQELADARARTQGALTQEIEEARSR